ncbi:MAG: T9SS type A sorting domain-containing protein [Flavobacteriales bacterium]|nr:T9SS type A sorting domain-containing protein [Flavobacteriales bacterium]
MKKLLLLLTGASMSFAGIAQVQRTVLAEAFSNASCGPCASQNPAYSAFLDNNTSKVIGIKYQTNWPGTDPMNSQTQTWVGPRVTYYSVSGVPWGALDGTAFAGPNYSGALANLDQAELDARYGVTTPFAMNVLHSFNANNDSIFIEVTITTPNAYSNNTAQFRLHVAMIEKEICFTTAPGSNGEKNFHNVVRRMYPDANGTSVQNTWNTSESLTFNFSGPIPNYIYDESQIAVVAFIQNNTTKEVFQAGISNPIDYLMVTNISGLDQITCGTSIDPVVTIKNKGSNNITSAIINYQINNNPVQTTNWSGSLALGASANVNIPTISGLPSGTHTLKVWVTNVNNNGITTVGNCGQVSTSFYIAPATAATAPISESFTSTTFPPVDFGLDNPDGGLTWTRVSTGNTSNSMRVNCFNYGSIGAEDALIVKPVNISALQNPTLTFDVAHAIYNSSYTDRLKVEVSTDCGDNWNVVYNKAGSSLATAPATTSNFTPTATQWRNEQVDLSSYGSATELFIKFVCVNGYGNNIYVDNINVMSVFSSIEDENNPTIINIYPNPAHEFVNISLNMNQQNEVQISLINMLGEVVMMADKGQVSAGSQLFQLNTTTLAAGLYNVSIKIGDHTQIHRIIISK